MAQTAAANGPTVMLGNSPVANAGSNKEHIVDLSHRHFDTHPQPCSGSSWVADVDRARVRAGRDWIGSGRTHLPVAADGR
jgi:hypothetical protein